MLSKMFKGQNPFNDQDPSVRCTALQELDLSDPEALSILMELLATDPDSEVRQTAASLCPDPISLANLLTDSEFESQAESRILAEVTDLVGLAITHPQIEIRKRLAVLIDHEDQLMDLEKRSRDHDKALNRYARDALQQRQDAKSKRALARQQAEDLVERLENHLKQVVGSSWAAKAEALLRQWQQIDPETNPSDQLATRYQTLARKIADITRPSAFVALTEQAETIRSHWQNHWPVLTDLFDTWQKDWLETARNNDTTKQEAELFVHLCEQYQKIQSSTVLLAELDKWLNKNIEPPSLDPQSPGEHQNLWHHHKTLLNGRENVQALIARLQWPDWLAVPPNLQLAEQHLQRIAEIITAINSTKTKLKTAFAESANHLEKALVDGQSNHMVPLLTQCRELLKQLPKSLAEAGRDRIDLLGAKFDELRDWKTYATEPKREAYCTEMELLITSNTPINERAEAIKELRNRWTALGTVRGKAGYGQQKRFNDAANRAFEPCRQHFVEQTALRKENLLNRKRMLAQLEEYIETTDWLTTDIKAAETILRSVRKEWAQYRPIPKGQVKTLEAKLDKTMAELHNNIKRVWQKNISKKEALVASAKDFLSADSKEMSIDEKINSLKDLQAKWQAVGSTPRGPDQKLWKFFRVICDQVFGLRDQERQEQNKAFDELRNQARAIIKAVEQAVLEDDLTAFSNERLREFQSKFRTLNAHKSLVEKFTRAASAYKIQIKQATQRRAQEQTLNLKTQDEQLHAWEQDSSQPKPENIAAIFADRLLEKVADADDTALRKLVINAELLAGVDSPSDDANLRMSIQVEHLKSGLGKREKIANNPTELAEQWCQVARTTSDIAILRERFFTAIRNMY